MSIEQFLQSEFTFTGLTLIMISGVILIIVLALLSYSMSLRSRVQIAETPKYGFLGKPLYQMIVTFVLVGAMGLGVYSITSPDSQIDRTSALEEIDAKVDYEILQRGLNYQVEFDIVPVLNGKDWGGSVEELFNVYVNFDNGTQISEFFYEINSEDGVKFQKVIPPGQYNMRVTVVNDNNSKVVMVPLDLQ